MLAEITDEIDTKNTTNFKKFVVVTLLKRTQYVPIRFKNDGRIIIMQVLVESALYISHVIMVIMYNMCNIQSTGRRCIIRYKCSQEGGLP